MLWPACRELGWVQAVLVSHYVTLGKLISPTLNFHILQRAIAGTELRGRLRRDWRVSGTEEPALLGAGPPGIVLLRLSPVLLSACVS